MPLIYNGNRSVEQITPPESGVEIPEKSENQAIQAKVLEIFKTVAVIKKEQIVGVVKSILEEKTNPDIEGAIETEIENLVESGKLIFDEEKHEYSLPVKEEIRETSA